VFKTDYATGYTLSCDLAKEHIVPIVSHEIVLPRIFDAALDGERLHKGAVEGGRSPFDKERSGCRCCSKIA